MPKETEPPGRSGLYDPRFEHDACGFGFVVDVAGRASHRVVRQALQVLSNLEHRGAAGSERNSGDGAGLVCQLPHAFLEAACRRVGFTLPPPGDYAVGSVFLPVEHPSRAWCERRFEEIAREEGLIVLGWRDVPVDDAGLGPSARASRPTIRQVVLARGALPAGDAFERKLFVVRRLVEKTVSRSAFPGRDAFYVASLSSRTVVYKGMLNADQLAAFFPDLGDPAFASALAMVHSRFSTNTFPSWSRAHPYRYISHNGEINTLRGNVNWMRARQRLFSSSLFGADLAKALPVIDEEGSDSAIFDNVLELLVLAGRSLPHALAMMIPEPWSRHESMSAERKAFYEFHSCLMEPWDGPASIGFTDGVRIGAILDRNGLRPSRWLETKDGLVVMASESGVLDIPASLVARKGRVRPGRIFLVDTAAGRVVPDGEIKRALETAAPWGEWLARHMVRLKELPEPPDVIEPDPETVLRRQQAFGYTLEEIRLILDPMGASGVEPIGSMGTDVPLAVLSESPQPLFDYFKQLFAQVTNPPVDADREAIVMAVDTAIGPEGNLLEPTPESCRHFELTTPVLRNVELEKIRRLQGGEGARGFRSITLPMLFPVAQGGSGLRKGIEGLRRRASEAIAEGHNILVLSDRGHDAASAPIPALLALSAVQHHLLREGSRTRVGLVVETGEAREVHHFALLIGYGASAVNPYLAFETLHDQVRQGLLGGSADEAEKRYVKAANKGLVKVLSKMGISAVQSYHGAQVFEALGLSQDFVDEYFSGTPTRIGGIGIDAVAREVRLRHERAWPKRPIVPATLDAGGTYQYRRGGAPHRFEPETIHLLQSACRTGDYELFKRYSALVDAHGKSVATIRALMDFKPPAQPVPIEEVEPLEEILARFKTGAMSYGSISREAHEALAIAMNRIGGRSNTGEGGEDPARYVPLPNGDSRVSAIKQVASARFGVTSAYLVSAKEIQIKMAQGAKPGEGGQLPGAKVYPWIAKVRHATPGVGLISPPPHHDIYSIEDLAQLIYDLKCANPEARISVKLVSEAGVGTIAAGVAKAHADVILISGYDGGTGAAPLTSIRHAGVPWELGLAEAHQVLVLNNLRSRVALEADGQLKTGRDVVVAALLGAEEFGFATTPLVALGCVMMRACHLNTCPVGVATQDPVLRERFTGDPAHVENFMRFVAMEVRELMARLGYRQFYKMVGRSERLEMRRAVDHWKARTLDFSRILWKPTVPRDVKRTWRLPQEHGIEESLDATTLIPLCGPALEKKSPVSATLPIRNRDRAVGTMLGSEVTRRFGADGLPDDTIRLGFLGSAGQSFGAFLPRGITLHLEGDANDYVGKGLSGGKLVVVPPANATFVAEENVLIGNVALYGATGGEAWVRGVAGERFGVRNSGATAVVEAIGDHGCEYMTGGTVVVLGRTGRNFAAGMSGGVAFILDRDGDFAARCNTELVGLGPVGDACDQAMLRGLVEAHAEKTGSARARQLLDDWDGALAKFVKVFPHDYRRVLEAQARMRATGLPEEEAVMAAFEENARNVARAGARSVGKPTGFLEFRRELLPSRPPLERVKDWKESHAEASDEALARQGARCMECGTPFCHTGKLIAGMASGCPLSNLIPEWNDLVYRGLWREAAVRLHQTNNFPEFTGRVCPAPCEGSCTLALNDEAVTIKTIECAIADRAFAKGWVPPESTALRTGKRVAVVGSGPAGLAAAAQLNRAGHTVTVYERADRPGGLLMYGIPNMKLDKRLVERRIRLLADAGVRFVTGVAIGRDVPARSLVSDFDASVLCCGATLARDLPVEGRALAGVHLAMEFLSSSTKSVLATGGSTAALPNAEGKDVVVLGGGDTGTDCVGTALRQKARSVTQLEILPRPPDVRAADNPWPQWPKVYRVDYGQEEAAALQGADPRVWGVQTTRLAGDAEGRVAEVHAVGVEWKRGADGRHQMLPVPGTERVFPAQLVLLALGFLGPERGGLVEELSLKLDERGNVITDAEKMTSVPGVFAAGDMARGQSLVVWAIHEGRQAARGVDRYLMYGETALP